jgi:FAD/FMN-containing dehydrogenase
MRANHADRVGEAGRRARRLRVPFTPPVSLVNRLSLRPFNAAYYQLHKLRAGRALQHYQPFFYPLDSILDWNRIYGPRGFYQYQCVLPPASGPEGVRDLLDETTRSNDGSFLAVLKVFGDVSSLGLLSFPRPGVTLALDFPNWGAATLALLERLDKIVGAAGGCIYGAKDARMPAALFRSGYPGLEEFLPFRDPGMSSGLSRRLLGS